MLTVSLAEEKAIGTAAAVAVKQDYSIRIPSKVSSSSHRAKDMGSSSLAGVENEGEGTKRGQCGDEEDNIELDLGLSLGRKKVTSNSGAIGNAFDVASGGASWGDYCRIHTTKDFLSIVAS